MVVKFPWITFFRVKKLKEFSLVSRHLVYISVTEQWLVEDTLPQECCRESFCWQKKSAQSISHAALLSAVCVCGGGCCCCLHRDFFAVFSKCWPNLDLAMNFCLSLNIKNNFYYRKFQTYIEVDRIIWVLMPFLFYISFPTFFLTWNILKKTPATC